MRKHRYKIFYSWQSDTPSKERKLIDSALKNVCERILRERGIKLVLDESTLGESGMPSITETVLRKIDDSEIFLCDLTPVIEFSKKQDNGTMEIKQLPNSNVLVELGYAMCSIGMNYIVPLAHKGSWNANQLPFDINHHKIDIFSEDNIESVLYESLSRVLDYIKKNGVHRRVETPYVVYAIKRLLTKMADFFKPKYNRSDVEIRTATTVFFRERMCDAFPGVRGLVEYTKVKDIKRSLSALLAFPLNFQYCLDSELREYSRQPIWWFERGSASFITEFKHICRRRFLIEGDEYVIKRIVAFSDSARYYSNFVYVETEADKPIGLYKRHTREYIEKCHKNGVDLTEEFAVYRSFPFFRRYITRNEFDDGCFRFLGRTIHLRGKAQLRCRHLMPYNFVIAAKFSAFNNLDFEVKSDDFFDEMLQGMHSNEDLKRFMMQFPKPRY